MKKLAFATIVALLVILAVGVLPVGAITWGELDTTHTNVGAMVVDYPGYGPVQWCSGTLIHPRVFLTAGHCTDAVEAYGITQVWVNFDSYALNEKTLLDVEQVITHPDYYWGPTSNPYDVGILVLKKPVKKLELASMPAPYYLDQLLDEGLLHDGSDRATFVVVGYGLQEPPGFAGDDMRRVAYSEYRALLNAWLRMSQNRATDDSGTCYGDSGGPAFWVEPDGTEILVGVTSWGDAQCKSSGFDYRVDIPETLSFIDSVIASLD